MNATRTVAAAAGASALVYVLYISQVRFDPSSLLSPQMLALTIGAVVAVIASVLYAVVRRNDLDPLVGRQAWAGWVPFVGGFLLYVAGTYSLVPDLVHWASLWLLAEGLAVLFLGTRSWDLAAPSLSVLILMVPAVPPQGAQLETATACVFGAISIGAIALSRSFASWVKLFLSAPFLFWLLALLVPQYAPLGTSAASAFLGLGSLVLVRRSLAQPGTSCELDSAAINNGRSGCVGCGRPLLGAGRPRARSETAVLAVVLVVAIVAWSAAIPVLTLTETDVNLGTLGLTRFAGTPYIAVPQGFLQNYSAPSRALERSYGEQLVVVKHFFPAIRPENFSYTVYVEAASSHAFLVKHWEFLAGYNRTTETFVANGSVPLTVYSTLLSSSNGSVVAVSYEVPATMMYQGKYVSMYVGVSALAYPSFNLTHQEYEAVKAQMLASFVSPQAQLVQASSWTDDIALAVSTLSSATPFASFVGGAAFLVGMTGLVLNTDRSEQTLLDKVEGLSYDDKRILAAALALRMHSAPKAGRELFSELMARAGGTVAAQSLYWRLLYLEKLGLIKHEPVLAGGRLGYKWRLAVS